MRIRVDVSRPIYQQMIDEVKGQSREESSSLGTNCPRTGYGSRDQSKPKHSSEGVSRDGTRRAGANP